MNQPRLYVTLDQISSATFPPGCGFGSPNPLSSHLRSLKRSQLSAGSILLMLKLIELRLEMKFLSLVKCGAFFLRKMDPIPTGLRPLDSLFQRLTQLFGAHA